MAQISSAKIGETKSTWQVKTIGKGSGHISSIEEIDICGKGSSSTDQRYEDFSYADRATMSHGENIVSNDKNFSQATPNGTAEYISASSSYIDGNAEFLAGGGAFLAEMAKQKIVASRSQPETLPDESLLPSLTNLLKPQPNLLKRAQVGMLTQDEVERIAQETQMPSFVSNPLMVLSSFLAQYSSMFALCSAKGAQQIAEIYAGDVKNNMNIQKKNLQEISDKAQNAYEKEDILKKIASGDVSSLFKSPSTEKAPRVQNHDEDEMQKQIADSLDRIIAAERMC